MQKKLKLRREKMTVGLQIGPMSNEVTITMSAGDRMSTYIISDKVWQDTQSAREEIFDRQLERFKKELLEYGIQGV